MTAVFASAALAAATALAAGPDVIVGDLHNLARFGRVGTITGYGIGTVSCNVGDQDLQWQAFTNRHPVIAQNMYRLKDGRFEQIGLSWVKHAFVAAGESLCGTCNGHSGQVLGAGCSDPYSASLNGMQFGPPAGLGPRSEVNAATGQFPFPYGMAGAGDAIYKRVQVQDDDIRPSLNAGALYFVEGVYITADDAAAGHGANNASHRRIIVTEGTPNVFDISFPVGSTTQREKPAIQAWKDQDAAVTLTPVDVPGDGRLWVASKATLVGGATWRYEYAIENVNSDRCAAAVRVPLPVGVAPAATGFHDVAYHSGEPYSGADWIPGIGAADLTWSAETFAQNPQANALRWGTLYNVRFEADAPPVATRVALRLFKPSAGWKWATAAATGPAAADCNTNGTDDAIELSAPGADCNSNALPDVCELDGDDCNTDGTVDGCQSGDCNTNLMADVCDLSGADCDGNGLPDVCQPDCDYDGTIDACEGEPDCNTNATPDSCDVAGQNGGVTSLPSGTIDLPIPGPPSGGAAHTIAAASPGLIADVNVQVTLSHGFLSDLIITIEHGPATATLWSLRCGSNDNINATFDDEGAALACAATVTGAITPASAMGTPLSVFDGLNSYGGWTLRVTDTAGVEMGVLHSWSLIVTTATVPPASDDANTNTVPDECECISCPGDLTGDGRADGDDVAPFVTAYFTGYVPCADMDAGGPPLTAADLSAFIEALRSGPIGCP